MLSKTIAQTNAEHCEKEAKLEERIRYLEERLSKSSEDTEQRHYDALRDAEASAEEANLKRTLLEAQARERDIEIKRFKAEWNKANSQIERLNNEYSAIATELTTTKTELATSGALCEELSTKVGLLKYIVQTVYFY